MRHFPYYKNFSPVVNFFFLFSVLSASFLSVWFLGKTPLLAVAPIILIGVLALLYIRSWKLLFIYLFFAALITGLEIFFISIGFWSYEADSFLAVPLYLPFVWGNIGILCVGCLKGITMITGRRFRHAPPNFLPSLFLTLSGFLLLVFCIRFFVGHPLKLVLILLCVDILYIISMRSIPLAFVGIFALACGAIGDLTSVWLGIWNYSAQAKIAGVPPYIFIGWDLVGILIAGLYLVLDAPDAPLPRWMKKSDRI